MQNFRVGVDIGGTFTDIVFLGDDGEVLARKIASTPNDYSEAVLNGIKNGVAELGITSNLISEVSHGFTVATNAIIEQKGAKTALITTEGFRDILEFRRNRIPRLYDLDYEKPPPLVKRQFRLEVSERLNFQGEVLKPLNMDGVDRAVQYVLDNGVESVAVCLLHSYANPEHEQIIAQTLAEKAPGVNLTISSELLPEMKEYERTSTTVINCYVRPVVESYLIRLTDGLSDMGVTVPLTVMQSNGGLATSDIAKERPVYCIESGPAAGVVGAYHLGKRLGIPNLMTLDMGGTTAKASIIEDGEMLQAPEYEVGGEISVGHRLLRGSGHILRVPAIDLAEVGAGGGSIAAVDRSGSLRVGPQSSGAFPGPACYQLGGQDATVTDANVLLGFLHQKHLLAGTFEIDAELARKAISDNVAKPLEMTDVEAAFGIHTLVNSNMGRALRAVSSERGRDPRRFDLITFGGSGPVHAVGLAEMLDITRVVVPPFPGVFSSFGLLVADVEHHFVQTYFKTFEQLDITALSELLNGLWNQGRNQLRAEGFDDSRHEILTQMDMKYDGQVSDLTVPYPSNEVNRQTINAVIKSFDEEHERSFGYNSPGTGYQLVNVRVIARGLPEVPRMPEKLELPVMATGASEPNRDVYFGATRGWASVPIVNRQALIGATTDGPLIVEEYDSTTVVPPNWNATIDKWSNIILEKVD
ncbi:MAG TPA: hydantoinase/oxoprolinase family protein [Dehalococcoidia bacterium]|nr:hydantoinase/oxoprolinase family protein [Dehalococcoidia bacterium]HIL31823.1 hydantoinase/oxoprolinase family protein [Dehalococcoidia bacterium]